ncbi:MAG: GNAT family N-acetyltransferase [Chloroflexota bacterium]
MAAPVVYTPRLKLRALLPTDAHDYARVIFRDPDVMRYLNANGTVPPNPLAHALKVIERRRVEWATRGYSAWAVQSRADGTFLGHAGLYVIDNTDVIEIGYAVGQAYWGQGYATEAARAVLRYAFETIALDKLVAVAFPQNIGSERVMQKLGMTNMGITDRFYGLELTYYTMTRAQYEAQRTTPTS